MAIAPAVAKAICEWVDGVQIVGEFGLQPAEEIAALAAAIGVDVVQVGRFAPLETLAALAARWPVIQDVVISLDDTERDMEEHLAAVAAHVQYVQLSFDKNGLTWPLLEQGRPFGAGVLADWCDRYPILLSMDVLPEEVAAVLGALQPDGLAVKGGSEEKIGYKSFDELDAFFDSLGEG